MVTLGNSSRRSDSTSPMDRWPRSATGSGLAYAGQEHQPELADLHLVTVAQPTLVDAFPVDVGAVQRAHVPYHVLASLADELGVTAGDGDVVEEDVALGVSAGFGRVVLEHET